MPAAPHGRTPRGVPLRRSWNIARDVTSAVLLVAAALLPWNLDFGVGVPDGNVVFLGLVLVATVLSLVSLAVTFPAHSAKRAAAQPHSGGPARIRLVLNAPYLALVVGVVGFTLFEMLRYGGTGEVPSGVGPGALAGLAGALLAAQPLLTGTAEDDARFRVWFSLTRTMGLVAMVVATFSFAFILYWRVRYVVPGFSDPEFGEQNVVTAATAIAYGLIPLIVVLIGLRWLLSRQASSMLVTVALGASTVLGAVTVWLLPIGREIDAFHGIAQATTTAGAGFEVYLAWVAGGAIVGPLVLRLATRKPLNQAIWQDTARRALTLIAVYCVGSALLRVFDLVSASILGLPTSPYDSIALLAFDVVAAVVTIWLRFNVKNPALHPVVISAISGVLVILVACRVVVGVGLAQRILYVTPPEGPVYGNTLAQQITSTFDVVMCFLALAVACIALLVQRDELGEPSPKSAPAPSAAPAPARSAGSPLEAVTSVVSGRPGGQATEVVAAAGGGAVTQQLPRKAPKIARREQSTQRIKIATPGSDSTQRLSSGAQPIPGFTESTQRFPAGTTHTGTGQQPPKDPPD